MRNYRTDTDENGNDVVKLVFLEEADPMIQRLLVDLANAMEAPVLFWDEEEGRGVVIQVVPGEQVKKIPTSDPYFEKYLNLWDKIA